MFDASRLLGGLVGGALPGTASRMLRQVNRQGGTSSFLEGAAVPGGVLGLLGGLAVAAYDHYSEQQKAGAAGACSPPPPPGAGQTPPPPPGVARTMPPPPPSAPAAPPPAPHAQPASAAPAASASEPESTDQALAMLLIQAMIAAAKADGEVDAEESTRILSKLEEVGASMEERAWVMAELSKPLDVAALIEQAREPGLAVQVYAASLLAIDVDTEAERRYLIDLREQLRTDPAAIAQIHNALNVPAF